MRYLRRNLVIAVVALSARLVTEGIGHTLRQQMITIIRYGRYLPELIAAADGKVEHIRCADSVVQRHAGGNPPMGSAAINVVSAVRIIFWIL